MLGIGTYGPRRSRSGADRPGLAPRERMREVRRRIDNRHHHVSVEDAGERDTHARPVLDGIYHCLLPRLIALLHHQPRLSGFVRDLEALVGRVRPGAEGDPAIPEDLALELARQLESVDTELREHYRSDCAHLHPLLEEISRNLHPAQIIRQNTAVLIRVEKEIAIANTTRHKLVQQSRRIFGDDPDSAWDGVDAWQSDAGADTHAESMASANDADDADDDADDDDPDAMKGELLETTKVWSRSGQEEYSTGPACTASSRVELCSPTGRAEWWDGQSGGSREGNAGERELDRAWATRVNAQRTSHRFY